MGGSQEPIIYFIIFIKYEEAEPLRGIIMRINIFHTTPSNNYLRVKIVGMIINNNHKTSAAVWVKVGQYTTIFGHRMP